jgi:hypothetical protein
MREAPPPDPQLLLTLSRTRSGARGFFSRGRCAWAGRGSLEPSQIEITRLVRDSIGPLRYCQCMDVSGFADTGRGKFVLCIDKAVLGK